MKKLLPLLALVLFASPLFLRASEGIHTKGVEPAHISRGEAIDLVDYLVPGKTTIFDFSSEYCPPCRAYVGPLTNLHRKRDDIAVVRVDINRPDVHGIDWSSPVAKQFALHSIPSFKIYGPDGKLMAEDKSDSEDYAARFLVDKWLEALDQ